ncbi:hypothetical protein DB32_007611 [Sandaracinus amylolyticus]|uniref:Uncharacterized protein n=1 Tax=Sandaracinus amylolyticus TaxID=927083 RepID=A0A0F6W8Y1_9BACT|nr:hypothetical protein DB32_007611 [Sandaracinus amylolyticus]
MTVTETVAACGGFDPMETVTSSVWRIDTSDGDAFVNGACRLPLDVRSETEAAFAPTRCLTTLPDFRHLTMMVTGGMLVLDGDFLSGDMQYEADVEGLCATGHMTFEGRRR